MYYNRGNLLIGFHGCSRSTAELLLSSTTADNISRSTKPYDWLGHGVYFWENNLARAWEWAQAKATRGEIDEPAVIGAVLSLDHCFDLLDSRFIDMLRAYHDVMVAHYTSISKPIPANTDSKHDVYKDKILRELDCAVIEFMHQKIREKISEDTQRQGFAGITPFDSARGMFAEGGPAFTGAGVQLKNHIQICIRNLNCIKGFFLPRQATTFLP